MTATFDDDPLENLDQRMKGIEQAEQQKQFFQQVSGLVNQFKAETPDYDEALQHVMTGRLADLKALGMPEAEAAQVINAEAQFIASQALARGRNPGEAVYELAKNRGFQGQGRRSSAKDDDDQHGGYDHEAAAQSGTREAGGGGDELAQAQRETFGGKR